MIEARGNIEKGEPTQSNVCFHRIPHFNIVNCRFNILNCLHIFLSMIDI